MDKIWRDFRKSIKSEDVKWRLQSYFFARMKWLKIGIVFVVFLSAAKAAPAPAPFADEDDPLRLPRTSYPISYDITLSTSVHAGGARNFNGHVKILIEVTEVTSRLTVHSRGSNIQSVILLSSTNADVPISQYGLETDKSFLHIDAVAPLTAGRYTIEITYTAQLNTGTNGFYRSSYTINGETR